VTKAFDEQVKVIGHEAVRKDREPFCDRSTLKFDTRSSDSGIVDKDASPSEGAERDEVLSRPQI
jgi:hypothetical protein